MNICLSLKTTLIKTRSHPHKKIKKKVGKEELHTVETEVEKATTHNNKIEDDIETQQSNELVKPKADPPKQTFMCKGCDKMRPKEDKWKRHMSTHSSVEKWK